MPLFRAERQEFPPARRSFGGGGGVGLLRSREEEATGTDSSAEEILGRNPESCERKSSSPARLRRNHYLAVKDFSILPEMDTVLLLWGFLLLLRLAGSGVLGQAAGKN